MIDTTISDDELRRMWHDAGGNFHIDFPARSVADADLVLTLRSLIDRIRAEERERCAQWHEEQAEIAMNADSVTQKRGIARLGLADFHQDCAAAIREHGD